MKRWIWTLLLFTHSVFAADYSDIASRPDAVLKELQIFPAYLRELHPPKPEPSGFQIGGSNTTPLIRSLKSIHQIPIAELENSMRRGGLSGAGFLGAAQSLLEVLANDNDVVLAQEKTHRAIGYHLRILGELGAVPDHADFTYRGERFSVERFDTHGVQESPFQDGTKDGRNAVVTNLHRGNKVTFALLVPRMIERYGFYEGPGTPYRVDPQVAMAVLGDVLTSPLPGGDYSPRD